MHQSKKFRVAPQRVSLANETKRLSLLIWRWHFWAGLLVIPFVLLLSITGCLYLFKPQIEGWLYQDLMTASVSSTDSNAQVSAVQQLAAVKRELPGMRVSEVRLGAGRRSSQFVATDSTRNKTIVYVAPKSGKVLGRLARDSMLMQRIRKLHGELLAGPLGSAFVELTACWLILLLISGVYLFWPRNGFRVFGLLLPRVRSGGRVFWRDLHGVIGIHASFWILLLVVTGLPWTGVFGAALKKTQAATGQARTGAAARFAKLSSTRPEQPPQTMLQLGRVVQLAGDHGFDVTHPDTKIVFPRGRDGVFGVVHDPRQPQDFRAIYFDRYTGDVVDVAAWQDYPTVAKLVTLGIRLHQGELFGTPNVIVMLLAAASLIPLCISGLMMWWRRRPKGTLGQPPLPKQAVDLKAIAILTVALGLLLPMLGISLIVVWLIERARFKTQGDVVVQGL